MRFMEQLVQFCNRSHVLCCVVNLTIPTTLHSFKLHHLNNHPCLNLIYLNKTDNGLIHTLFAGLWPSAFDLNVKNSLEIQFQFGLHLLVYGLRHSI